MQVVNNASDLSERAKAHLICKIYTNKHYKSLIILMIKIKKLKFLLNYSCSCLRALTLPAAYLPCRLVWGAKKNTKNVSFRRRIRRNSFRLLFSFSIRVFFKRFGRFDVPEMAKNHRRAWPLVISSCLFSPVHLDFLRQLHGNGFGVILGVFGMPSLQRWWVWHQLSSLQFWPSNDSLRFEVQYQISCPLGKYVKPS